MGELIRVLSDTELISLAEEAQRGGEELETARALLRREMGFRGLIMTPEDSTGLVDALEDTEGMIEPQHEDEQWPQGPRFLHAPERVEE